MGLAHSLVHCQALDKSCPICVGYVLVFGLVAKAHRCRCPSEKYDQISRVGSFMPESYKDLKPRIQRIGQSQQSPWVVNTDYQDTRHLDTLHRIYTRISFLALHRSAAWGGDGRSIHSNPVNICDFNCKTLVCKNVICSN